jgi:hypothetical protein
MSKGDTPYSDITITYINPKDFKMIEDLMRVRAAIDGVLTADVNEQGADFSDLVAALEVVDALIEAEQTPVPEEVEASDESET